MNNSNNNNNRTATLKVIMRMAFITLLLMPLGEWKNNGNDGEGNVQQPQYAIKAQTMCKFHFHVHRPPRHIHRSSRSRNHDNGQASSSNKNTSLSIKQRINTWCKETRRKLTLNQAIKNYTNDNSTVVTIGRQAKFNRQLKLQQGTNNTNNPTREDIRRGFYIKNPNTTAWKPKPMSTWNNTSTAWTATTNTWLNLLVLNSIFNNGAQAMRQYRHDGTTMTWDADTTTTNTKTIKQQQTMEETMAYITSIIVALFIITMVAINLRANKKLKERKEQ